MNEFFVFAIGYFVIALIVFAVLDYLNVKKNISDEGVLIFISILWIFLLGGLIFAMPFCIIDKLIKRNNKL